MDDGDDLTSVTAVLDDEYARSILAATSREALGATELAERIDADVSTVYRRLDRLESLDLVTTSIDLRRDAHHAKRYRARLQRVTVELHDGEFHVAVERERDDPADRLTDLFEELR